MPYFRLFLCSAIYSYGSFSAYSYPLLLNFLSGFVVSDLLSDLLP